MEITIIENLQREDLNPVEQARAFERLSREFGLTQEQIASRTGKDRASIANFIRLLKLPEEVQNALEAGALSFGHGKVLLALAGFPEHMERAAREIIEKQEKPAVPVEPNGREAQRSLESSLVVKVEIHERKGKGKIILKYGSLDDFDRILEALAAK
jgi:ParB family chromosome partitioning protein